MNEVRYMAENLSRNKMRKTTIELPEEQYFFLKERALELQRKDQNASLVSILRELIHREQQRWNKNSTGK
jgi:hypothetical protein